MRQRPKVYKRGRFYWFNYTDNLGNRRKRSTGKERVGAAEEERDEFLAELKAEAEGREAVPTLEEFATGFFDRDSPWVRKRHARGKRFSERHRATQAAILEKYILPRFGSERVDRIRRRAVSDWLVDLKLANQTKNHILTAFRFVIREAHDAGYLEWPILDTVERFSTRTAKRRDVLTSGEWHALFPWSPEVIERHLMRREVGLRIWQDVKYYTLGYLLATTGLRLGEAVTLTWGDIIDDSWLYLVQSKTGGTKLVYLTQATREYLQLWRGRSPWTETTDYVFWGRTRKNHVFNSTISKLVSKAIDRAGIDRQGRWLTAHSLRHTYNTMLRRQIPDDALRLMTGHQTEAMTAHYDHPDLEALKSVLKPHRERIERALG